MSEWDPTIAKLIAAMKAGTYNERAHEALKAAYREGVESGGARCCGSTGVEHLPLCPTGEGVDLATWLEGR